jgi:ribosomal protein S12 methylthiotransferase accessory factor YcaO
MIQLDAADGPVADALLGSAGDAVALGCQGEGRVGEPGRRRVVQDLCTLGLVSETPDPRVRLLPTELGDASRPLVAAMYRSLSWIQPLPATSDAPFRVCMAAVRPSLTALGSSATADGVRVVAGCGASLADATLRCIAEGVERHALQYGPAYQEQLELAVSPAGAVAIDQLLPPQWDGSGHPPDPTIPRRWLAADWCTEEGCHLVPAAHVLLGYPARDQEGWPPADSSGAACGVGLEDAAGRAVIEVIERDAVALWWHARRPAPPLAAAHLKHPWLQAVIDWLWRLDRCLWFLDIGSDLGVPVVVAVSCDRSQCRLIIGTGAGPTPMQAARSALAEHLLMLVNLRAVERRRPDPGSDASVGARMLQWHLGSCAYRQPQLFPYPNARPAPAPRATLTITDIFERLRAHRRRPLFFVASGVEAPLMVVKCVVPGLASRGRCPPSRRPLPAEPPCDPDERAFPY